MWPKGWSHEVCKRGLRWPWIGRPPPLKIHRILPKTSPSVDRQVEGLIAKDVVEEAKGKVYLNRLFEVPKKDTDEMRLVLDTSSLNKHIKAIPFRMVSLKQVRMSLFKHAYVAAVDLKDAYWHIPIHPRYRKFLAFAANKKLFCFKAMPFGLNLAPRVFSKMMKVLAGKLQEQGVCIMYLDDWLIIAESPEECTEMIQKTMNLGRKMGLLFNLKKSKLNPTNILEWLGMVWNTASETLSLSPENQQRCWKKIFKAKCAKNMSLRQWESLIGSLNHACEVVPYGRLRLRRLILEARTVFRSKNRDSVTPFPPRLRSLLKWWSPKRLSAEAKWMQEPSSLTLVTDASDHGWGYQSSEGHHGQGLWDSQARKRHINWKELQVIYIAMDKEKDILNHHIRVLTDNTSTMFCINKLGTSRSLSLLRVSEKIFQLAQERKVQLSASHIPGKINAWADALSRQATASVAWILKDSVFQELVQRFGLPEIDLFASAGDHKVQNFISRTVRTPAGGPDALSEDWNRWTSIYLFPPPNTSLMLQIIQHLRSYRGRVLLIAPLWKVQPWTHALLKWCPNPYHLQGLILEEISSMDLIKSLNLHAWSFYRQC